MKKPTRTLDKWIKGKILLFVIDNGGSAKAHEIRKAFPDKKPANLNTINWSLGKEGMLEKQWGSWHITQAGREYVKENLEKITDSLAKASDTYVEPVEFAIDEKTFTLGKGVWVDSKTFRPYEEAPTDMLTSHDRHGNFVETGEEETGAGAEAPSVSGKLLSERVAEPCWRDTGKPVDWQEKYFELAERVFAFALDKKDSE